MTKLDKVSQDVFDQAGQKGQIYAKEIASWPQVFLKYETCLTRLYKKRALIQDQKKRALLAWANLTPSPTFEAEFGFLAQTLIDQGFEVALLVKLCTPWVKSLDLVILDPQDLKDYTFDLGLFLDEHPWPELQDIMKQSSSNWKIRTVSQQKSTLSAPQSIIDGKALSFAIFDQPVYLTLEDTKTYHNLAQQKNPRIGVFKPIYSNECIQNIQDLSGTIKNIYGQSVDIILHSLNPTISNLRTLKYDKHHSLTSSLWPARMDDSRPCREFISHFSNLDLVILGPGYEQFIGLLNQLCYRKIPVLVLECDLLAPYSYESPSQLSHELSFKTTTELSAAIRLSLTDPKLMASATLKKTSPHTHLLGARKQHLIEILG